VKKNIESESVYSLSLLFLCLNYPMLRYVIENLVLLCNLK